LNIAWIEELLGEKPLSIESLSGGDIAHTQKVSTRNKAYFIKSASFKHAQQLFKKEAIGLQEMAKTKTIGIPKIMGTFSREQTSCLILEHIASKSPSPSDYECFGRQLAQLHCTTTKTSFGFETDNAIILRLWKSEAAESFDFQKFNEGNYYGAVDDKVKSESIPTLLEKFPEQTDYIFVGGSRVEDGKTDQIVKTIKKLTSLPVILFPGDVNQITPKADGLLFLSLMSGENPEYLIRQQIKSVKQLKNSNLEIIPTGYILIDGGKTCTTEKITRTNAIPQTEVDYIVDVALAAQYSGKRLIYLEAGSGAKYPVSLEIITEVRNAINVPIIVGGGIRNDKQRQNAYDAGADMAVMGSVFEE